jgi:cephalosporin-C deacetylase-like acetyl esterase
MIRNLITIPALIIASLLATAFTASAQGNSLTPYTNVSEVPQTAVELWKDYDPRKEDLEVKTHMEWKQDGVVTRLISFKVGTFKGSDSRIAAYYCFPDNGEKNPAFVWSHGGAQRAHRNRGFAFATQGFATVDINWLGRPLEKELDPDNKWGTDWGKIDPAHGGNFYPKALREDFKYSLTPDAHSIDPIMSPRNSNWFILSLAGRRAHTFLEQQPEVDPSKLGFAGFSMGGVITSMTAIDKRLKAVAPFVGGTTHR